MSERENYERTGLITFKSALAFSKAKELWPRDEPITLTLGWREDSPGAMRFFDGVELLVFFRSGIDDAESRELLREFVKEILPEEPRGNK